MVHIEISRGFLNLRVVMFSFSGASSAHSEDLQHHSAFIEVQNIVDRVPNDFEARVSGGEMSFSNDRMDIEFSGTFRTPFMVCLLP